MRPEETNTGRTCAAAKKRLLGKGKKQSQINEVRWKGLVAVKGAQRVGEGTEKNLLTSIELVLRVTRTYLKGTSK